MKRKLTNFANSTQKKPKITPIRVISWNLNGIRAQVKKGTLNRLFLDSEADFFCFQEIKLQKKHIPEVKIDYLEEFYAYWNCSEEKKGYAGVAVFARTPVLRVTYGLHHSLTPGDGRLITCEYPDFYLVTVYFPQPGANFANLTEKLAWEMEFKALIADLQRVKPVICIGDFNIIMNELDCPEKHRKKLGKYFDKKEIDSFNETIGSLRLCDSYRYLHPDTPGLTYFSLRSPLSSGWRLDYCFLSQSLQPRLLTASVLSTSGSDHFPLLISITS